jgi:hypothetical protein
MGRSGYVGRNAIGFQLLMQLSVFVELPHVSLFYCDTNTFSRPKVTSAGITVLRLPWQRR